MHLVRLDIDRKNAVSQLQVGPLGGGLNAVYSPIPAATSILARFVRTVLFRGSYANDLEDHERDSIDGSLQWVDASGHVRMMSYSGGSALVPSRFVHSPLHPSEHPLYEDDAARIRGVGNLFWEGDEDDGRWDDLRSDILGMLFCSPLGSVSPEKLWWSASRLGVHAAARSELDEGYRRLKEEEHDLLDRLRHAESVDHDRVWWSTERARIQAELSHIAQINAQSTTNPYRGSTEHPLSERIASIKLEIARLRALQQDYLQSDLNARDGIRRFDRRDDHRISSGFDASFNTVSERQNLASKIERLLAEQANVESQLRQMPTNPASSNKPFDDGQLQQQLAHADEMLRRWDRRATWHRRLAEVQSHLRTRSPYRRTSEGSLIPIVEKYLRELTSGALRQLPAWAVEASYLYLDQAYGTQEFGTAVAREQRGDYFDRAAPAPSTRQRCIVDLAIRLAIAQAASTRIGRIPMLLENSIDSFRGEALEQILHVLAAASRDGRQVLLTTRDEYIARRISAHGGSVSRVQEVLRYAQPRYVIDTENDLGVHPELDRAPLVQDMHGTQRPLRVVSPDADDLLEVNRRLSGLASEIEHQSWWQPHSARPTTYVPQPVHVRGKAYYLHLDSSVGEIPGLGVDAADRLRAIGVHRVVDFLNGDSDRLANAARIEHDSARRLKSVAELMCSTPQLRPFDARVLVACGIARASQLKNVPAAELVERVDRFLGTDAGRQLAAMASDHEVSRIRNWIAQARGSGATYRTQDEDRSRRSTPDRTSRRPARRIRLSQQEQPTRRVRGERDRDTMVSRSNKMRPNDAHESARERVIRTTRSTPRSASASASQWRFYLELDSPVVDAPSIGPRMAERLTAINIASVGDLVSADPSAIAAALSDKAVTHETVIQWQQQAMLVCRIPNLRGHDAQLLVAAGMNTAEQVSASDSTSLHDSIARISSSKTGQRILRGSVVPDRSEIGNWIEWAQNCRAVRAA